MNIVAGNSINFHSTLWKLRKLTLTEKIFRQITYLVIYLVKLLLSRNFCQKCVRVNYRYFHTVQSTVEIAAIQCETKSQQFQNCAHIYGKNFVKVMLVLNKELI